MIQTYGRDDKEYTALTAAADLLTVGSPHGTTYTVGDVYFDLGQGWMWTTIIATRTDGSSWQALDPREHSLITDIGTVESIFQAVEAVRNSKWNPDR